MTDAAPVRTYQSSDQRDRATAILDARQALESKGAAGGAFVARATNAPLVEELLTVAQWIVSGELDEEAASWWINRGDEQPRQRATAPRSDVMPCLTEESR